MTHFNIVWLRPKHRADNGILKAHNTPRTANNSQTTRIQKFDSHSASHFHPKNGRKPHAVCLTKTSLKSHFSVYSKCIVCMAKLFRFPSLEIAKLFLPHIFNECFLFVLSPRFGKWNSVLYYAISNANNVFLLTWMVPIVFLKTRYIQSIVQCVYEQSKTKYFVKGSSILFAFRKAVALLVCKQQLFCYRSAFNALSRRAEEEKFSL